MHEYMQLYVYVFICLICAMYVDETQINYKTAIPNEFKVRAVHEAC